MHILLFLPLEWEESPFQFSSSCLLSKEIKREQSEKMKCAHFRGRQYLFHSTACLQRGRHNPVAYLSVCFETCNKIGLAIGGGGEYSLVVGCLACSSSASSRAGSMVEVASGRGALQESTGCLKLYLPRSL